MEIDDDGIPIILVFWFLEVGLWDVEDQFKSPAARRETGRDDDLEAGSRRSGICVMVEFHPNGHEGPPYWSFHVYQNPARGEDGHVMDAVGGGGGGGRRKRRTRRRRRGVSRERGQCGRGREGDATKIGLYLSP